MRRALIKNRRVVLEQRYSESFKRMVVQEYEKGFLNKDQLRRKYHIGGNSCLLVWCRKYGKLHYPAIGDGHQTGRPMKDPQKQRIKELEARLRDAELKLKAYEKLIVISDFVATGYRFA